MALCHLPMRCFEVMLLLLSMCVIRGARQLDVLASQNANGLPRLQLNANTFGGNVLRNDTSLVRDWIVLYSLPWHEPCAKITPYFFELGEIWQDALNYNAILSLNVRFASVDCSTDKQLCNLMGVDEFPMVRQYRNGQVAATWVGKGRKQDYDKFTEFLQDRLKGLLAPDSEEPGQLSMSPFRFAVGSSPFSLRGSICASCIFFFVVWTGLLGTAYMTSTPKRDRRLQLASSGRLPRCSTVVL
eukprot:TRINITY_DN9639_c0_g3_i1.p1 TRINITY_DN9639_c0_g3~~TRINITY_DN9639_c0_g3_i1.p1  ORF type:complete len:260 (-),score=34.22 TRINITY_DN9639_c0_g3_i1:84-812(-)